MSKQSTVTAEQRAAQICRDAFGESWQHAPDLVVFKFILSTALCEFASAAREKAIEEAAKIMDVQSSVMSDPARQASYRYLASAIRSLSKNKC